MNIALVPGGKIESSITRVCFNEEKDTAFVERADGSRDLILGIGKFKEMNRRKVILLARRIIVAAKEHRIKHVAIAFEDFLFPQLKEHDKGELASLLAQNFELANYEYVALKTPPEEGWKRVEEIVVSGAGAKSITRGFEKGQEIGRQMNACRDLANMPGSHMTPSLLANAALRACKGTKIKVTVLGKKEMEKLGMGAVLGVGRGSSEEPKFIVLEYMQGGTKAPVVLCGKGVTFDTGGLNVKGGDHMLEMHMDMSGGAAVLHTLVLADTFRLKKNIVGLIPTVENMPSGSSYRPGDVLKTMSGKTIEVLNTDAEGRVILADALCYAKKYNPRLVVTVATLTGASLIALGQHASAIMTREQKVEDLLRTLGEEAGDYVWPLPLWDEYEQMVKGEFGDVANITPGGSRNAGTIGGGMFLYQFAKDFPFVHIDMAPRMTPAPGDHLAKGAIGAPVQLLLKLLEKF